MYRKLILRPILVGSLEIKNMCLTRKADSIIEQKDY